MVKRICSIKCFAFNVENLVLFLNNKVKAITLASVEGNMGKVGNMSNYHIVQCVLWL